MAQPNSDIEPKDAPKDDKNPAPEADKSKENPAPSPSPVQAELEKSKQGKPKRSQKEILDFHIDRLTKKRDALPTDGSGDPAPDDEDELDDDTPVTIGMLKKKEVVDATAAAKSIADRQVEDPDERELVKHYLDTRIIPSGDSEKDYRDALALVNVVKNGQVIEELSRKQDPQQKGSGSGAPGKHEPAFEPTPQERIFMGKPYNLSKEDIIKSREKEAQGRR
jgi:hypothetical protein